MIGFMGSGKTTVGEVVAARSDAGFHDLDRMIEAAAGRSIAEIFDTAGEGEFRKLEGRLLPAALERGSVAALGGGTPCVDACWKLVQVEATVVWLDAPFAVLWERVQPAAGRPLIAGRTRAEVEALFTSRLRRYGEAEHRVDAAQPLEHVIADVVALWSG